MPKCVLIYLQTNRSWFLKDFESSHQFKLMIPNSPFLLFWLGGVEKKQ